MDKQQFILALLKTGPKTFEYLFRCITQELSMHRDGLESILDDMKKQKLITPANGAWMPYMKPPVNAVMVDDDIKTGGLMYGC